MGTATIDKDNHSLSSVTKLAAQNAIFKFTTKNSDGSATIDVTSLTVTIGAQNYVITHAATSELYAALPAISGLAVTFTATGSDSKTYTASKASVTFAAGNYYQSVIKIAEAALALNLTSPAVGQVIGSDGINYAANASLPTGVSKVAVIVSLDGSQGLALAMQDAGQMTWADADTYATNATPKFSNATWRVPTNDDWWKISGKTGAVDPDNDNFNSSELPGYILNAGGSNFQDYGNYWSGSEYDASQKRGLGFSYVGNDGVFAYFGKLSKTSGSVYLRLCLAFSFTPAPAYTLLSAATTADYGKVVCAAGHLHDAKTALPAGCTAVGILGKVTSTGHGLILALQDATSQKWNTINGWTSETTYAGTTLKVLPDDAARGSLTSYTTLGETTVSNWAVAQKSDYEAIFTNLGSTKKDNDGTTYDANVNAFITTGVGGTAISGSYWSATDKYDDNAWVFFSNYWDGDDKEYSHSVRPVLGF